MRCVFPSTTIGVAYGARVQRSAMDKIFCALIHRSIHHLSSLNIGYSNLSCLSRLLRRFMNYLILQSTIWAVTLIPFARRILTNWFSFTYGSDFLNQVWNHSNPSFLQTFFIILSCPTILDLVLAGRGPHVSHRHHISVESYSPCSLASFCDLHS